MINLKNLEKDFENTSLALQKKGVGKEMLETIKTLFKERKNNLRELEANKAEQNKNNKLYGEFRKKGEENTELKDILTKLKNEYQKLKEKSNLIEETFQKFSINLPNIPDTSVPEGNDENDNVEIKKVLIPKTFDFKVKNHWELENQWLDFKRGAKLAGSRFTILRGEAAKLERALINFFLDKNAAIGFEEVAVPYMVNQNMLFGTGQFPKFKDDLYKIEDENLYLIPTGEVPLTNIFNDEILNKDELPILLTANTPCFRKEAGSAGRDTRGMIRQHQFNKVEMVAITTPEQSEEIFQKMVDNASSILEDLGLPHRLVQLCGGDLGFSAMKTIDLEVWLPGEGQYREISSISNTGDFQARRAKIRYKDTDNKNKLVNTLNGSGLAVGRTLIAIMENYQNEDGTITIPDVLNKYIN